MTVCHHGGDCCRACRSHKVAPSWLRPHTRLPPGQLLPCLHTQDTGTLLLGDHAEGWCATAGSPAEAEDADYHQPMSAMSRKEMLEGRSNVHVRPLALHPSPAPPAALFSQEFTPAKLLARPARRLAPRKSAFLLWRYQISGGPKLSGCVHYRPCRGGGVRSCCLGAASPCHQHRLSLWHLPVPKVPSPSPPARALGMADRLPGAVLGPGLPPPSQGNPSSLRCRQCQPLIAA